MLFALSTSHEIGLAATGAIFIIFALASSFLFPRINPNFPGKKGLRWYIPLCFVFFIAMMSSVLYFGREQSVAEATPGNPASAGNAASGKALFIKHGLRRVPHLHAGGYDGQDRPEPRPARELREQGGAATRGLHHGGDHPPAGEVRAAGLPDERDARHLRQIADHQPGRRSGRVPQLEVAARPSPALRSNPCQAPLRFGGPGEVAEWLKAAPC